MVISGVVFAFVACFLTLDRRRLLGRPVTDLLGMYTGAGLVKKEVYERDILGLSRCARCMGAVAEDEEGSLFGGGSSRKG